MPVSIYTIFLVSLLLLSDLPWVPKAVMVALLIAGIEVKEFYVDRRRDNQEQSRQPVQQAQPVTHAVGFGIERDE